MKLTSIGPIDDTTGPYISILDLKLSYDTEEFFETIKEYNCPQDDYTCVTINKDGIYCFKVDNIVTIGFKADA